MVLHRQAHRLRFLQLNLLRHQDRVHLGLPQMGLWVCQAQRVLQDQAQRVLQDQAQAQQVHQKQAQQIHPNQGFVCQATHLHYVLSDFLQR